MPKKAIDSEYLSGVWERINSEIYGQGTNKMEVAEKCGFDRRILTYYGNISITYFARICEELNVSADFFLFGLDKHKERTNKAVYQPDVCYEDMPKPKEIIKEAKRLMQCKESNVPADEKQKKRKRNNASLNRKKKENEKGNIALNNKCGIGVQKELMTLADDFCFLERDDVKRIIETCRNYDEGQRAIMEVYKEVYLQ